MLQSHWKTVYGYNLNIIRGPKVSAGTKLSSFWETLSLATPSMCFSLPFRSRFTEWQLQHATHLGTITYQYLNLNQSFTWYLLLSPTFWELHSFNFCDSVCFYQLLSTPLNLLWFQKDQLTCNASYHLNWTCSLREKPHILTIKTSTITGISWIFSLKGLKMKLPHQEIHNLTCEVTQTMDVIFIDYQIHKY